MTMQRYESAIDGGAAEWRKAKRVLIALACLAAGLVTAINAVLAA